MPRTFAKAVLGALLLILVTASVTSAQYNSFNQRDDQYRLLGLRRAKEAYEVARAEYERQQVLFDKRLITQVEYDRAKNVYADAEVNYQQSLLAVVFEDQYISVVSAVKYHAEDGTKRVKLTLANASGGTEEFQNLIDFNDELFRSLQPDMIHNVYVSLLNDDNAIISQPYECKISELRYGSPQTVEFKLLQDVDAVSVFLIYGNGSQRTMKIFLQKDATVNKVAVQSEQFSQEVEIGKTANYDLRLELYSGVNNTFALEVVNLPKEISRFIKNPTGNVRLRQVKFTESSRTKRAVLQITLPDRAAGPVIMDESIPFYVLALPTERMGEIPDLATRQWTEDELDKLDIGYVRLEILPRGKGELAVRAPQLFHSVMVGDTVEFSLDLTNEGSHRLDYVEIKADPPLNWTKEIVPTTVSKLDIGEESRVTLRFVPPEDVSVGKYEIRVFTSALSNGQPISGTDKIATIEIRESTNIAGTALLVLFIVGVIGTIVAYGIRLTRK